MASTSIRVAHDLQVDPAEARPYLPKSYLWLVGGFGLVVVAGLVGLALFYVKTKSVEASKVAKDLEMQRYVQEQAASGSKVELLKAQASKAFMLRQWVGLNKPIQEIYMDVLDTLSGDVLLTELTFTRSRTEPRIKLEVSFASEQTKSTQQFQKTLDSLLSKGYRTVQLDQSNIQGGVKFTCDLFYPVRGEAVVTKASIPEVSK